MRKRYSIGVLIGGVHTYFPQKIITGIRSAAEELSMDVYFYLGTHTKVFFQNMLQEDDVGDDYDYQPNTIYDYSLISGLDGLIINYGTLGRYLEQNDMNAFVRRFNALPTVVLTDTCELPNCHYRISDNYDGITQIMDHLVCDHGYRKIAFVSGPRGNTDAEERLHGYLDAVQKYSLPFEDTMIVVGDYSEFVDEQVETLLDHHPDLHAIVFANDDMTLAGYRVCKKHGLQIGKDIAVTGYDDFELAATLNPPLTTVCQDGTLIGRQAVIDLLQRFRGKHVDSGRVPVEYVCRESCGCHANETNTPDAFSYMKKDRRALAQELSALHEEYVGFQRQSWFLPFLARILNENVNDEVEFCRQIMINVQKISRHSVYMFLHETPVTYTAATKWRVPEPLYLASYHHNGEVVSYYPYDRPIVSASHGITEYLSGDAAHSYTMFLLYSNNMQYGVLACDIPQDEFPFFYVLSLQLGMSLQYLTVSKKERAYLLEMSRNMELIQEQNRMLDIISYYDELTGLLNLRGFMEQVRSRCSRKTNQRAYMIYADLDHLKEINDNWGHPEGNFAISSAGKILQECLRESDILGRIGGDEFASMVVSESESFEELFRKRIHDACRTLNAASGKPYYVEITLGVIPFETGADMDLEEIISKADAALYAHKKFRRPSVRREPGA